MAKIKCGGIAGCKVEFKKWEELVAHQKKAHGYKFKLCTHCNKEYRQGKPFNKHVRDSHGNTFNCGFCVMEGKSGSSVSTHTRTFHAREIAAHEMSEGVQLDENAPPVTGDALLMKLSEFNYPEGIEIENKIYYLVGKDSATKQTRFLFHVLNPQSVKRIIPTRGWVEYSGLGDSDDLSHIIPGNDLRYCKEAYNSSFDDANLMVTTKSVNEGRSQGAELRINEAGGSFQMTSCFTILKFPDNDPLNKRPTEVAKMAFLERPGESNKYMGFVLENNVMKQNYWNYKKTAQEVGEEMDILIDWKKQYEVCWDVKKEDIHRCGKSHCYKSYLTEAEAVKHRLQCTSSNYSRTLVKPTQNPGPSAITDKSSTNVNLIRTIKMTTFTTSELQELSAIIQEKMEQNLKRPHQVSKSDDSD